MADKTTKSTTKRALQGAGRDAHKAAVLLGAIVESLNTHYGLGLPRETVILTTILLFGAGKRLADWLNLEDKT